MSDENTKPPSMSNEMLNPSLNYVGTKVRIKFRGDCKHSKNSKHLHCLWNRWLS